MRKTQLSYLLCAVVAVGISCSDDTPQTASESSSPTPQVVDAPLPPLPGAGKDPNRHATLTQGKITALGLSIPDGMTPARAPEKVYRFEGNHPVFQAAEFVHKQTRGAKIEIEEEGYLMQRATVRDPKGSASGDELLSIRVFKGDRGGATIDIWLEREYRAALPSKVAPPRVRTRAPMSRTEKQRRGKEARETLEVMNKINRGEPLDENDRSSAFFH